ncbi:MAG TPA: hypothetical protein VHB21_17875 [Minicystis sp.]|nr:hypothetical protein [Minicystis sp.]
MMPARRTLATLLLALAAALAAICAPAAGARADDATPAELYTQAVGALDRGAYQDAIDDLELLSDRGFLHPDASFDRGLAYLMRLRARADRPGDLGRAAAAFEETLALRPGDADAARELDLVRREVTRRRARRGRDVVDARPTIDRAVVGLLPGVAWCSLALAASVAFALGLAMRRARPGGVHVAGSVLAPAAAVALVVLTPLAAEARWLAANTREAVVVAPDVELLDASGRPEKGAAIPEAASVETQMAPSGDASPTASVGTLVHVRWGSRDGFVPLSSLRLMPR